MNAHLGDYVLGDLFDIARGGSPRPIDKFITDDPAGLNWVKIGDATASGKFIDRTKERIRPEGLSKTRQVRPGDFLLTNSMSFGRPYIMATNGCIHDGWLLMRPRDESLVDRGYFYHLLSSPGIYAQFVSRAAGATVKNLNTEIVSAVRVHLLPLDEQRRIAAILDKADALRQKRKRAIALLDSLTRSIFLEMFGSASARKAKLSELAQIGSGSTPSRSDSANFGSGIPWVKTTEVKGGTITGTEECVSARGVAAARLKTFPVGTILMAMYGQGTTRGNVAMLGVPATINQACAAIGPSHELNATFLFEQLKLKYEEIRGLGRGGNQPNLNLGLVGSIEVQVPSLDDQLAFVEKLNSAQEVSKKMVVQQTAIVSMLSSLQHRAFSGQL